MALLTVDDLLRIGAEHQQAGRLDEAEAAYRQALGIDGRNAQALNLFGIARQQRNDHFGAVELLTGAVNIDPSRPEFFYNLGNSFVHLSRFSDAARAYATAARLEPGFFEAHRNLGSMLLIAGHADEAAAALQRADALKPDTADVQNNLGMVLKELGRLPEALQCFRRAVALAPGYRAAHDNLLYMLLFDVESDAKAIFQAHQAWAKSQAAPIAVRTYRPPVNDRSPDRRLKIAYVSPSLRDHPVGRAMLPLVENHDNKNFEIVCYADIDAKDDIANRLRARSDQWHVTQGLTEEQFAARVRADGIDILVDLTLHMAGNRLLAFAQRPAPVQVSFIGYPATTGLSQIDYRITDEHLDPPGETETVNSEKLVRLPHSFWCYQPESDQPEVNELPAMADGGTIAFGSLNNPCKYSQPVIEAWAKVLAAVPGSTLMLCANEKQNPGQRVRRAFADRGIDPARLGFIPRQPRPVYLAQYHKIDIALDPWPYNGHMTTCDALWMGVPVVGLIGQTSVGRGSLSILSNLDATVWLAENTGEYVHLAADLASDLPRLVEIRRTLRDRMRNSPLMDGRTFARDVESAYRRMWRTWCAS